MTFTPLIDTNGTPGDDFIVGNSLLAGAAETINALASDDLILGDTNGRFGGAGSSFATAVSIDAAALWTTDENPLFADSSIPHATLFLEGTAGQTLFSSVTIAAGQTITVDIDFGDSHPIGVDTDTFLELYDSTQTLVIANDDSSVSAGGAGSLSVFDSFLTFTAAVTGTYVIRFREFGPDEVFEGGETFVANISVGAHAVGPAAVMGADVLAGAAGADFLAGQGGADTLAGGDGNDELFGGSGNDSVGGGTGNDFLSGGLGADALNGGTGVDTADYSGSAAAVSVNLQTGTAGGGEAIGDMLTDIENAVGSAFNDSLTGNGQANSLSGGGGDDAVMGAGGNDRFAGSLGIDSISGGFGVDGVDYTDSNAAVTVNLQLGTGTGGFAEGDSLAGIENVIGSEFADTLTGTEVANRLVGGIGADTLFGDLGDDFIEGGRDSDTIDGSIGTDTASYADNFRGIIADLANNSVDEGFGDVDTLFSIERIIGSQGTDTFIGSVSDNVIFGEAGDDRMSGNDGLDRLSGGLDDDSLDGGTSDDQLMGEAGDDLLSGGSGNDLLQGGAGFDRLTGGSGNDLLDGGAGGDEMGGGSGNDEYRVNGQGDSIIEAAGNGVDRVTAIGSYRLAEGVSVEQLDVLSAAGTAAIDLTGNEISNSIRGNFGANRLRGEGGNDAFLGLDGNDHLHGGFGNDILNGGAGLDRFYFDTALNGSTNRDTINDYVAADDTIMLDRSVFSAIGANGAITAAAFRVGTSAADASDRIIYNNATGAISYDADGSGAGTQVQFARVGAGTALTRLDFVAFGSPSAAASSFADAPAAAFRAADHDVMLAPTFSPVEMMPHGANMHVV